MRKQALQNKVISLLVWVMTEFQPINREFIKKKKKSKDGSPTLFERSCYVY